MINKEEALKQTIDMLYKENDFLRQRNTDLRQKTWIQVYDENLQLIKTVNKLRTELIQMGRVADKFRKDSNDLYHENQKLKGVLSSVQTFIGQYSK